MSTPNPPNAHPQRQPMSLEESLHAIARLNDQMTKLNAKLAYLRLLHKLGVR